MKKVVVLIDGQNLYYTLKSFGLKELELNWNKIFQSFLEPAEELIRTYWFRPQKIYDSPYSERLVKDHVARNLSKKSYSYFKSANLSENERDILEQIETEVREIEIWLHHQKVKFSNIEFVYDQLSLDNGDIEIVKKGLVKVNPFTRQYIGEKGVDISLAVKMVGLSISNKCDKIILISGDYDYAEAISFVKNNLVKLNIVKLHKGTKPKNQYMSRELSVLADKVINLYETDIRTKFLK